MGIENAKHLGEMLLGMADQNLYTGGDYDTVIRNLRKNQIDLAKTCSFAKPIGPYGWNIPDCP